MSRKLASDEQALWARVVASVKPLRPRPSSLPDEQGHAMAAAAAPRPPAPRPSAPRMPKPALRPAIGGAVGPHGLDGSWEKRIARGQVQPDTILDLHGHNLANAHALLDGRIEQAILAGDRVLLLITGKAPSGERAASGRGAIRGAVRDWLAASRHGVHIAAVRTAHPRHGGAGALYIVLRRGHPGHRRNS
jgi:DNA-nicking Smr family endonuclease